MKIPVIIHDKIYIPRYPELTDMYSDIRNKFTHKNPEYHKKRAQGFWVGGIRENINTWSNVVYPDYGPCLAIPRGGMSRLRTSAEEYDVDLSIIDHRVSLPPVNHLHNDVTLWPIQNEIAHIAFKKQNCLIRAPTASGKTELLLKVAEWILKDAGPVLVIVWEGSKQSGLFKQWIDRASQRFSIQKKDIGTIGGGSKTLGPITIGMQQTLKNCGRYYTQKFGGIICDEVQRFAAPTFEEVVDIFPAKYRIGASADESRHDGKEFLVYDLFGEVAGKAEKTELIQQGKIHEIVMRIIPTEFDLVRHFKEGIEVAWRDLAGEDKDFNELLEYLCANEERNDLIWQFLQPCLANDKYAIIASHRVAHAKYWDLRIQKAGFNSGLMLGGKDYEAEFEQTMNSLKSRQINAGSGTIQKIATGHDIPAIDRGFVITPLANNRQLLDQFCGRIRRTFPGKSDAVVYYFWDKNIYPHHKNKLAKLYKGYCQIFVDGEFLNT